MYNLGVCCLWMWYEKRGDGEIGWGGVNVGVLGLRVEELWLCGVFQREVMT